MLALISPDWKAYCEMYWLVRDRIAKEADGKISSVYVYDDEVTSFKGKTESVACALEALTGLVVYRHKRIGWKFCWDVE